MSSTNVYSDLTRVEDHPEVRLLTERRRIAHERMQEIEQQMAASPAELRDMLADAVQSFIDTGSTQAAASVAVVADRDRSHELSAMRAACDEIDERLRVARNVATDELIRKFDLVERAAEMRAEVGEAVDVSIAALERACDARARLMATGLFAGSTVDPGADVGVLKALAAFRLRLGGCTDKRRIELDLIVRR